MLCCEIRLWHKGFGKGTFDPHVFEDEVKFSSFESGDSRWSALLMPQKDLNDKGSQGTSDCAGMWSDGEGELQVSSSTVFLPQEPYLPEGSLRLWCGELMRDGDGRLETLEPGYNKAISGSQYLIECSWCVFWTSCHGFDVSLFLPQAGAHVSTWRVLAIKGFGLSPHLMSRVSDVGLRNQFNWDSLLQYQSSLSGQILGWIHLAQLELDLEYTHTRMLHVSHFDCELPMFWSLPRQTDCIGT